MKSKDTIPHPSVFLDAKRLERIKGYRVHESRTPEKPVRVVTPSQTIGPFFAYGLSPKGRAHWDPNGTYSWKETISDNLVTPDASGEKILIEGRVTDGDGAAINDAMIEIWQADAQGRYVHARGEKPRPNAKFTGFGRSATDKNGIYSFDTIKPGAVAGPGGKPQAPHIVVCIFSREMLARYFSKAGVSGALWRYGSSSVASDASYSNGKCSAAGSRKKSNGFSTDISTTRSTSMRNDVVLSGNTSRAM
jgi:protocatechuate 3,4-dioxygenase alpha subunit